MMMVGVFINALVNQLLNWFQSLLFDLLQKVKGELVFLSLVV